MGKLNDADGVIRHVIASLAAIGGDIEHILQFLHAKRVSHARPPPISANDDRRLALHLGRFLTDIVDKPGQA